MAVQTGLSFRFGRGAFRDPDVGMQEFIRSIDDVWIGQFRKATRVMREYLELVAADLARKHGDRYSGQIASDRSTLQQRSGKGVKSIVSRIKVTGTTWDTLRGRIGAINYLAVHEYGGTIGGRGKLLTIPLPAALTASGNLKKRSARDWDNTFIGKSKAGNLIIFQRAGGNNVIPLYLLRPSITIKPRLGMRAAMKDRLPYFVNKITDMIAQDFARVEAGGRAR